MQPFDFRVQFFDIIFNQLILLFYRNLEYYKYQGEETVVNKMRGLNRIIIKQLTSNDEVFLKIEITSAIVTGPETPLRFMGEELI